MVQLKDELERQKEFMDKCSRFHKASRTHGICICIEKPIWEGYRYGYDIQLHQRQNSGAGGNIHTKKELMDLIRRIIKEWEEGDGDHRNKPVKAKPSDVYLESFTPDITLAEIFNTSGVLVDVMTAKPCPLEESAPACTLAEKRATCRQWRDGNYSGVLYGEVVTEDGRRVKRCTPNCPQKALCDLDLKLKVENPEEYLRITLGRDYKPQEKPTPIVPVEKFEPVKKVLSSQQGLNKWF